MDTASNKAMGNLLAYVRRNTFKSIFDSNSIRSRIAVPGLKKQQIGGLIQKAIRTGIIVKIGETYSNVPKHKSGRVGVYMRGDNSYVSR